jgi:hypothetical protein
VGDLARRVLKEPGADDAAHYARRVRRLAASYVGLFALSVIGIALLVWRAQFFVTLSQRSNVETLTLAFLMVLFGYLASLSAPGTWGAVQILRRSRGRDWTERQHRLTQGLKTLPGNRAVADLNVLVEVRGSPGQPFDVLVADAAGTMGHLHVDGARLTYRSEYGEGSNEVLAYVERQVEQLVQANGSDADVDIVIWKKIDDEGAERYHGLVEFARNLERKLGDGALWPRVVLTPADVAELERRLTDVCASLRQEAYLPHWDYQAEHKLPIIPEPLGLITLSRSQERVDPVSSMGGAILVVLSVLVILVVFIIAPPWVPGT